MTTRPFQGHIDEVAMFLVDLTAGEVAAIYNSGSPGDLGALNPPRRPPPRSISS